jgi:hypothetical protein
MYPMLYDPRDWYWLVAYGPEDHVWSSRRKAYVPGDDADYGAFLASGRRATRIESEAELGRVLNEQFPAGSPRPHPANGAARRARQFAKALARDPLAALVQQAKEQTR